MTSSPTRVVAGYTDRVQLYRAEIATVPVPCQLTSLLTIARHVAEIPSGPGHFLSAYAENAPQLTLVDGNATMLAAAATAARHLGLRARTCSAVLPTLPGLRDVDLVALPNAALNQLAAQTPLTGLLTGLRRALPGDARLLAQVLDPAGPRWDVNQPQQDGTWVPDRAMTDPHGQTVTRHRRTRQRGQHLRLDFDYSTDGQRYGPPSTVHLRLLSPSAVRTALTSAGWTHVQITPSSDGLIELTARAPWRWQA